MSNGSDTSKWKDIWIILAAGGIGGFASWVFGLVVGEPVPGGGWGILIGIFLGAFAAGIGVFVLANTDRSDFARMLCFAALCGFAWKPVCEAGRAFIQQSVQAKQEMVATEMADEAVELAASLSNLPPAQLAARLEEVGNAAQDALEFLPHTTSPRVRRAVESKVNTALRSVTQVAPENPQVSARVIQSVGETAARNQAPAISQNAIDSMDRLARTNRAFEGSRVDLRRGIEDTVTRRYLREPSR